MFVLIGIISMVFFMGGACVGGILFYVVHGRFYDLFHRDIALLYVLPINLILLPVLVALWRHRETDEEAKMGLASSASMLFLHRVPFNKRMAFMVFSIVWIIGVVVLLKYGS